MVPRGWSHQKIGKYLSESRNPGSDGATAKKLTVKLYARGVCEKDERRKGSSNTKYYERSAGQLIYSKLDFLNGAFGVIPEHLDGYESTLDLPAFDVSPDVDAAWLLSHISRPTFYKSQIGRAKGGRKARRVPPKEFLSIELAFPPLPEQKKIAAILGSVDEAIAATQAVIDQTRKVKQGLLQQLLTRGIGHTRFKKTEIGEIPEEWEVVTVGSAAERVMVGHVGETSSGYCEGGIPFLRTQNVRRMCVDSAEMRTISTRFHDRLKKSQLRSRDVLIARVGANRGMAAVLPPALDGANCANIVVVRLGHTLHPDYLAHLINSPHGARALLGLSVGSAQGVINTRTVERWQIPGPPMEEQVAMVEQLNTVDAMLDACKLANQAKHVLKRGLMQDLLTGRVRVKGAA